MTVEPTRTIPPVQRIAFPAQASMLFGSFESSIDPRCRCPLPEQFAHEITIGSVLTYSNDGCLHLFPAQNWQVVSQQLWQQAAATPSDRLLRRLICASARLADLDAQGRLYLPADLRQHAALCERVVCAGMHTYIEIWAAERWHEVLNTLATSL